MIFPRFSVNNREKLIVNSLLPKTINQRNYGIYKEVDLVHNSTEIIASYHLLCKYFLGHVECLLSPYRELMIDQSYNSIKVHLEKLVSLLDLHAGIWERDYLQDHDRLKSSCITQNSTTAQVTHRHCNPGVLCFMCRLLDEIESLQRLLSQRLYTASRTLGRGFVSLVSFRNFHRLVRYLLLESHEFPFSFLEEMFKLKENHQNTFVQVLKLVN